jgi:hypothetical protein
MEMMFKNIFVGILVVVMQRYVIVVTSNALDVTTMTYMMPLEVGNAHCH